MKSYEVNFDGIVGPSHNYAGLAEGNLASSQNRQSPSSPRKAALQGLEKMNLLHNCGLKQAVLPPHERPYMPLLKRYGFSGTESQIIQKTHKQMPHILATAYSASSMWTANCATACPSIDSIDHKLHLTPANLISNLHRSTEAEQSHTILRTIFSNENLFIVHPPLTANSEFADEGAANHIRFCSQHESQGVQLFVYGYKNDTDSASRFKPRQAIGASQAIIDRHRIITGSTVLAQQSSLAIDNGVFHNDVISTGNMNFFLVHENSFENQPQVLKQLQKSYAKTCSSELIIEEIPAAKLPLKDAVRSYLLNTQIVSLKNGSMLMIAPAECNEIASANAVIEDLISGPCPLTDVKFLDLRESMKNGGGPACLRMRVTLNEKELMAINQGVIFNDQLYESLKKWIHKHYREEIVPADLADPSLPEEIRTALDELTQILNLGSIYSFQ